MIDHDLLIINMSTFSIATCFLLNLLFWWDGGSCVCVCAQTRSAAHERRKCHCQFFISECLQGQSDALGLHCHQGSNYSFHQGFGSAAREAWNPCKWWVASAQLKSVDLNEQALRSRALIYKNDRHFFSLTLAAQLQASWEFLLEICNNSKTFSSLRCWEWSLYSIMLDNTGLDNTGATMSEAILRALFDIIMPSSTHSIMNFSCWETREHYWA